MSELQDDFAVLRTHGFCENMADRKDFGDRQCWERRWHRKNWCIACTERTDAIARIEARVARLEGALREIVDLSDGTRSVGEIALIAHRVARSALAEPTAEDVGKLREEREPSEPS